MTCNVPLYISQTWSENGCCGIFSCKYFKINDFENNNTKFDLRWINDHWTEGRGGMFRLLKKYHQNDDNDIRRPKVVYLFRSWTQEAHVCKSLAKRFFGFKFVSYVFHYRKNVRIPFLTRRLRIYLQLMRRCLTRCHKKFILIKLSRIDSDSMKHFLVNIWNWVNDMFSNLGRSPW